MLAECCDDCGERLRDGVDDCAANKVLCHKCFTKKYPELNKPSITIAFDGNLSDFNALCDMLKPTKCS